MSDFLEKLKKWYLKHATDYDNHCNLYYADGDTSISYYTVSNIVNTIGCLEMDCNVMREDLDDKSLLIKYMKRELEQLKEEIKQLKEGE